MTYLKHTEIMYKKMTEIMLYLTVSLRLKNPP